MKIRIGHIQDTYNNGSLMMAVNTIEYICQNLNKTGEVMFFTDARGENNIQRIKNSVSCSSISGASKGKSSYYPLKKKSKSTHPYIVSSSCFINQFGSCAIF